MDLQYDFGLGTADNGNVNRITNRINTLRSLTYQYDELNRIHDAVTDATSGQFLLTSPGTPTIQASMNTFSSAAGEGLGARRPRARRRANFDYRTKHKEDV
jgi:hypothetical protein